LAQCLWLNDKLSRERTQLKMQFLLFPVGGDHTIKPGQQFHT